MPAQPEAVDPGLYAAAPPNDEDAEKSVLGALLSSKDALGDVVEVLKPEDFYRPNHQDIYRAVCDLFTRNEPADAVMVGAELDRRGQLQRIGGAPYLLDLVQTVPSVAAAAYYAELVKDASLRRGLAEVGTRAVQYSRDNADDGFELIDRTMAELTGLIARGDRRDEAVALGDLLGPTLQELEAIAARGQGVQGVPTGFPDLDEVTTGLHPGQMIIIAARPGTGKSTLALDICRHAAIGHEVPSAFFSLEMTREELTMRLLAAQAGVKLNELRAGTLDDEGFVKLARCMADIADKPLFIDDSPMLNMALLRAKARRLHQKHGLGLLVVDYLQLMSPGHKSESRQQEVSEISRGLKLLAKELEIPVIAICQLNRGSESRSSGVPAMSDLRESGSLEQDCDLGILLHDPTKGPNGDSSRDGEVDMIIGKHRNGRTPTIRLANQLHMCRFSSLAMP